MKILFTLSPYPAHLQVIRPTIAAAVDAGHEVVVASGPDLVGDVPRRGLKTWPIGPTAWESRVALGRTPRRPQAAAQQAALVSALYAQPALARIAELQRRVGVWTPDLVVHDVTELAGVEVAARLGIRHVAHGVDQHADRAWPRLPLITAELAAADNTPDRWRAVTDAPFLDPNLWPGRPLPFRTVLPVGPAPAPAKTGRHLPLRVQRFEFDHTVFVAVDPQHIEAVLAGVSAHRVNIVLETGTVEAASLGSLPNHIAAGQNIPLELALPKTLAVISNAGSEVLTGAIVHGRPQLTLPTWVARRANAVLAARRGAAITVNPERLQPGTIRRALGDLLASPAYANSARGLGEVVNGMPTAAQALDQLISRVPA